MQHFGIVASYLCEKKVMKRTVVTIDTDDIFRNMTRTAGSAYSAIKVSEEIANEFHIANLCLRLFDKLQAQPFHICASGDIFLRITSPTFIEITLDDVWMIIESLQGFYSGSILRGFETDDSTGTINIDLIFEITV